MEEYLRKILLDRTNGGKDIFTDHCGYDETCFSKKKFKERQETQASASFAFRKGVWLHNDFGTADKATDGIGMYARQNGMKYYEALYALAVMYGIETGNGLDINKLRIEKVTAPAAFKPGDFGFNDREFMTKRELAFLGPKATKQVCDELHYKSVESMWFVDDNGMLTTFYSDDYNMIFRRECRKLDYEPGDSILSKVYQPRSEKYKFSYRPKGMEPGNYVHGLYELKEAYEEYNTQKKKEWEASGNKKEYKPQKLDRAVLCCGERDAICVRANGDHPIWLNSETAKLTKEILDTIKQYAYKVYYIPDCDDTGAAMGRENAFTFMELYTVWLPNDELSKRMGDQHKPMKDFRDWCGMHRNINDYRMLMNNARPLQFWEWKGKKVEVNSDYLYYFLAQHGFYRMKNRVTKEYELYHILGYGVNTDGYIVDLVTAIDIRAFLLDWINSYGLLVMEKNAIIDSTRTSIKSLEDLWIKDFNFSNCTINSQDFYAENTAFRITADGIKQIDDRAAFNYVLSDKVIKHKVNLLGDMFTYEKTDNPVEKGKPFFNVTFTEFGMNCKLARIIFRQCDLSWRKKLEQDEEPTDFENYETQKCLQSTISQIGFICHRYKDVSRPWLSLRLDWKVGKDAHDKNGRNGKTIIYQILTKVVNLNVLPIKVNKKDALDYNHVFGSVKLSTDVIMLDEIPENFDYVKLNDETSLGIFVNRKNKDEVFIESQYSPKFLGLSNYPAPTDSQSEAGRYQISVVSDYFHQRTDDNGYFETRKVNDEFHQNLWDENYSEEDWEKDINFIFQCVKFYLYQVGITNDKLEPPMSNIIKRQNQAKIDPEFDKWAEDYFFEKGNANKLIRKDIVTNDYNSLPEHRFCPVSETTLKKMIREWCAYKDGVEFNPIDKCTDKKEHRIRINNNVEHFYVAVK